MLFSSRTYREHATKKRKLYVKEYFHMKNIFKVTLLKSSIVIQVLSLYNIESKTKEGFLYFKC